jgi:hypothetical protein
VSSESTLPSEVEFAAFLVFNPRPVSFTSEISIQSRRIRDAVKNETAQWARTQRLGERLRAELGESTRDRFLPPHATHRPDAGG